MSNFQQMFGQPSERSRSWPEHNTLMIRRQKRCRWIFHCERIALKRDMRELIHRTTDGWRHTTISTHSSERKYYCSVIAAGHLMDQILRSSHMFLLKLIRSKNEHKSDKWLCALWKRNSNNVFTLDAVRCHVTGNNRTH